MHLLSSMILMIIKLANLWVEIFRILGGILDGGITCVGQYRFLLYGYNSTVCLL